MKYVPIFFLAILLFSCSHHASTKDFQKLDTVLIAASSNGVVYLDSAIRVRGRIRAFKDSGLDGKMVEYTAYRIGQMTDTVRDSLRRPKLDSAHRPIVHLAYSAQLVDTAKNKFIRVLDIPKN